MGVPLFYAVLGTCVFLMLVDITRYISNAIKKIFKICKEKL